MNTSAMCITMKTTNIAMPMKWMERAACRPPNIFAHHGKRPTTAGDITGPVRIISGATMNTIKEYINCCSASYGWKCSIDGTPKPA